MALEYRFLPGWTVQLDTKAISVLTLTGRFLVQYDNGEYDGATFTAVTTTGGTQQTFFAQWRAKRAGRVVDALIGFVNPAPIRGEVYAVLTVTDQNFGHVTLCRGYIYSFVSLTLGYIVDPDFVTTWVMQGTVLEDGTGGTHVSSLTVSPGAGNEMQLLFGMVVAGAGAANLTTASIDDGTNLLVRLASLVSLGSGERLNLPTQASSGIAVTQGIVGASTPLIISGTMRLVIQISTATTGLTHTFAVACRIKGAIPTATLADTVGTPTLTTNTNAVFG